MSKFDPQKHHRRSIRLQGYDYASAGGYFVTIVAWQRECLFGKIENAEMVLNEYGNIADECWRAIPEHFPNVELGAFVIMPNHVHGIIYIVDRRGTVPVPHIATNTDPISNNNIPIETQGGETPPLRGSTFQGIPTLGKIIAYFKYKSTKEMNLLDDTGTITKFWQRNYYEHIIRDDKDLRNKTEYILANPLRWSQDDENPVKAR